MPPVRKPDAGDRLREIVAFVLDVDVADVRADASFQQELKVDSLEKAEIAARIEQAFGIALGDDETAAVDSVRDALDLLAAKSRRSTGASAASAGTDDSHASAGTDVSAASVGTDTSVATDRTDTSAASAGTDASVTSAHMEASAASSGTEVPAGSGASAGAVERPAGERPAAQDRALVDRLLGAHLAAGYGERTAYADPDAGTVSYARLHAAAQAYARALAGRGVPAGSRGLVVAEDSVATVVAVLGLWWHGCVPVPVSPMLGEDDIRFVAADCGAAVVHLDTAPAQQAALRASFARLPLLTGDQVRDELAGAARPGPPVPVAHRPAGAESLIQYTSGSTGRPKGVRHSAAGIHAMLDGYGAVLGLRRDDVVLSTARMSFGYGFGSSVLCTLAAGASAAVLRGTVDARSVSAALRRHRPTVLCSVPRLYAGLLDAAGRLDAGALSSVRLCLTAGEHCPAALSRRIEETFGAPVMNCLGATEVMHVAVATPPDRSLHGLAGLPVPGVTVTVHDERGRPVPDGTDGRLHIAGPTVSLGYVDRPEADAVTFAAGGAYTGDVVRRNPDGTITYLCRADDILNLGGYKVVPREIEDVVRSVDGVTDCVVVGAPGPDGLQRSVAFTVAAEGTDRDRVRRAVRASVRSRLAPYKRPSRFEFVDALPATATGKLAAYRLRERIGQS